MLNEQIPSIPWLQLTTPYGRGTAIPQLIEQEQYIELAELVEHQGTLWQGHTMGFACPSKKAC
ncbi:MULTISPECIES: hypothetical protein [Lysinibacillus]|uniref:hypothetical protein n=1 Tax=Lysinibacillus TaxID=400634 RepID=UPI000A753ED0|nr:hypothetical protein [Lysinibacillus sphaericus]